MSYPLKCLNLTSWTCEYLWHKHGLQHVSSAVQKWSYNILIGVLPFSTDGVVWHKIKKGNTQDTWNICRVTSIRWILCNLYTIMTHKSCNSSNLCISNSLWHIYIINMDLKTVLKWNENDSTINLWGTLVLLVVLSLQFQHALWIMYTNNITHFSSFQLFLLGSAASHK